MEERALTTELGAEQKQLGGPRQLTEALLDKRRQLQGAMAAYVFGDLTELELHAVLRCAYEVSFKTDEGRYPKFTIVVPTRAETHLHESTTVVFRPPVTVTSRTLKRLAAAVPPRPHGLILRATADGIVCTGIGRFESGT